MKRALAALAVVLAAGCGEPPPPGTDIGTADDPIWVAGDSISWPTAIRIDNTFAIGLGGTGCIKPATITQQVDANLPNGRPTTILVITGINDLAAGTTVGELAECAETFRVIFELQGMDVRFVTQPIPDHWAPGSPLEHYSAWLRGYHDTIDCGYAGHPTEPAHYPYPVHPTALGYDRYAACISAAL